MDTDFRRHTTVPYYSGQPLRHGPIEIRDPRFPGFLEARATADVSTYDWYERAATEPEIVYFAVVLATDGTPIGEGFIHDIDRQTGRAFLHAHLFRREHRIHGHGEHALRAIIEHAFRVEKLKRLLLVVHEGNFPARRCYAKCGFEQIDRLESDRTNLVMELTREEWRRLQEEEEWEH